jgi:hypothetical protein
MKGGRIVQQEWICSDPGPHLCLAIVVLTAGYCLGFQAKKTVIVHQRELIDDSAHVFINVQPGINHSP